jgi:hypothetical protein
LAKKWFYGFIQKRIPRVEPQREPGSGTKLKISKENKRRFWV